MWQFVGLAAGKIPTYRFLTNRILILKNFKEYYQIRNKVASIIQKGCENWLWKPICNNGTIGIIPLLEYKKIQEE